MHRIAFARARLNSARTMPDMLSAACNAFELMLATIREHEERADGLFAAFVMAAASAADGRDALLTAPSLPLPLPTVPAPSAACDSDTSGQPTTPATAIGVDEVADALAEVSQLTAAVLTTVGRRAADPADRAACAEAARCAQVMWSLLARRGP